MARVYVFIEICFVLTLFGNVYCKIPSYINICKRNDPNLNKCITDSIEQLREKLVEGIPELKVPTLDPFTLNDIQLIRGSDNARLDINLTDIQVWGLSKFVLTNLKANIDDYIFTLNVGFPILNFEGKYQINAKLLLFDLSEKGDLSGNFTDYKTHITLKGDIIHSSDHDYIHFERVKIKMQLGSSNIFLSNLSNSGSLMEQIINEIINTNTDIFIQEIMPELESSLSIFLTNIANRIVESFTYKEVFPEN